MVNFKAMPCTLVLSVLMCGCAAFGTNTDSVKIAAEDSFLLDTYCRLTELNGDQNAVADAQTLIAEIDSSFQTAYEKNANTLSYDMHLSECAKKTALLNEEYGDFINLTCGSITRLWGISEDDPAVPEQNELEKALESVHDTSTYADGDFSEYPDMVFLDFGSVSKGYTCDKMLEMLRDKYPQSCFVASFGSSALFYGNKPDGSQFTAAVKNPVQPETYLGMISLDGGFVSTAGGYERYFEENGVRYEHIMSIENGYPVETDLVSVTVIVPEDTENGGILSDFLATCIYAQGTAGLEEYLAMTDIEIIAADENGYVYSGCSGFVLDENSGFSYGKP